MIVSRMTERLKRGKIVVMKEEERLAPTIYQSFKTHLVDINNISDHPFVIMTVKLTLLCTG